MKKINLKDILTSKDDADYEVKAQVIKKLILGLFKTVDDHIEIEIILDDQRLIIEVEDNISKNDLEDLATLIPDEPSVAFLRSKLIAIQENTLVKTLNRYKEDNMKKGSEFLDQTWFKLYSPEEIKDPLRDIYGAKWIDYNLQLKSGNIISDPDNLYGLWAMSADMMIESLNKESFKHYGDHLFIVAPLPDELYFFDRKELIGPRYAVKNKLDFKNPDDIRILFDLLITIKKKELEKELKKERDNFWDRKDNDSKINAQLIYNERSAKEYRTSKIIFFLLGILIGVVIGKLM